VKKKTINFKYIQVYSPKMRKIKLVKNKLELKDNIEIVIEKTVTKFGNGAKLDCPKEFLGKKAYILIREN